MKKILMVLVLLIGLATLVSAQSITVVKPALNETWFKGQTYAIQWTSSGQLPAQVKIQLRNSASTVVVLDIVDPAPNNGSFQWPIPANVADGQYRIRVKAKGVEISGDSQVFNIAAAPPPPAGTITIAKPSGGDTWVKGQPCIVTWTQTGSLPNQVVITLMNSTATAVVKTLADPASNSGSYQGTAPADVADGQYRVRVTAKGTQVLGDSQVFNIAGVPPIGTITVTKPASAEIWCNGQLHTINWTWTGSLPSQVTISLMNSTATAVVQQLGAPTANSGNITGTFPVDVAPGSYRIRVQAFGADVYGDSQVFAISPNSIKITQPTTESIWKETMTRSITWTKNGNLPGTVQITLLNENKQKSWVIAQDAPNTGSYSWRCREIFRSAHTISGYGSRRPQLITPAIRSLSVCPRLKSQPRSRNRDSPDFKRRCSGDAPGETKKGMTHFSSSSRR